MDIAKIARAETTPVELLVPVSNEPTGIVVHVRSVEDEAVRKVSRRLMLRRQWHERKQLDMPIAELERFRFEMVHAAIEKWDWGTATFNGEQPAITLDFIMKLNAPEYRWIVEQIEDAAGDRAAFFRS